MEQVAINWFSVLGASLVGFAVGGLWYGPVFGTAWMRSLGMDPEVMKNAPKPGMARIFGITFVLQFIMAYCLAMFFGNQITTATGALYGFLAGLPWVAFALAINALYEQKPASYIFINGGYWTVTFTLMGLVLGTWHG
jgi:hypothetical protein